jgi:hypothetical protein
MSGGLRRRLASALWFGLLAAVAMDALQALSSAEKLHRWTFVAILLAAGYCGGTLGSHMLAARSNCRQRDAVFSGLFVAALSVAIGLLVELIARGHRLDLGYLIVFLWTVPLPLPLPLLLLLACAVVLHARGCRPVLAGRTLQLTDPSISQANNSRPLNQMNGVRTCPDSVDTLEWRSRAVGKVL